MPAHPVNNYAKLYAIRPAAEGVDATQRTIQRIWPFASGTDGEGQALADAYESREFYRSNGWTVRLSVWRATEATKRMQAGLVGAGVGTLAREWREPRAAEVVTAAEDGDL